MGGNRSKLSQMAFGTTEDLFGQESAVKGLDQPKEAVKDQKKSIQKRRVSVFCQAVKGEASEQTALSSERLTPP